MKKYFIYFICALFCCSIYAQQKQQKIQIPADFIALIDSIHANPYLSFHEYPIRLPLNDSIAATSMYYLTDSLAQTRNYINKKLAARVVYLYVYYYRKEKSINTWQHDLITKLIMTELKYCYRYNIDSPIPILQSSFYTPEIIEKLKDFFAHSTYTQEEAEVIAMSFPPPLLCF